MDRGVPTSVLRHWPVAESQMRLGCKRTADGGVHKAIVATRQQQRAVAAEINLFCQKIGKLYKVLAMQIIST